MQSHGHIPSSDPTIVCPHCQSTIKLTESLAAPLLAAQRQQIEQQAKLHAQQEAKTMLEAQLQHERRQDQERRQAELQTRQMEQQALLELKQQMQVQQAKLQEAQAEQAKVMRQQRELEDAKRELDLTIAKRVQADLGAVREQAAKQAQEAIQLRLAERDQTIASMQGTIEELKRKAEQGSQQLQGEVQELALEQALAHKFPFDTIEPVGKGEIGADVVQTVVGGSGAVAGVMLWETKRTKAWSDSWLPKLRDDQRATKADIAILVTQTLPKGVEHFDQIDGVWVCSWRTALPVALMLRQSLLQISQNKALAVGQQTKAEVVYQYLTGAGFRQRIEAMVEAYSAMQDDLASERKAFARQWAKREQQLERVLNATVGLHGDLQGIAGQSMPEIEALSLDRLGL